MFRSSKLVTAANIVSSCFLLGCNAKVTDQPQPQRVRPDVVAADLADRDVAEKVAGEKKKGTFDSETQTPPRRSQLDLSDLEPPGQRSLKKDDLARRRAELDETVWKNERLAQEYDQALVELWDDLLAQDSRSDGDKFAVLEDIDFQSMQIGDLGTEQLMDWGIARVPLTAPNRKLSTTEWKAALRKLRDSGYRIVQTEWHQATFDPETDGQAAKSTVTMAIYVTHEGRGERLVVRGTLGVTWRSRSNSSPIHPVPQEILATDVEIWRRVGAVPFVEVLTVDRTQPPARSGVQPVLVNDLNGDGLAEIVLGGSNQLFWNRGDGNYEEDWLCKQFERSFETGLLADLDGDSRVDYLTPGARGDLLLFVADEDGRYSTPPIGRVRGGGPLKQPQAITAGDIDNDGDLDVWIAQYKISYVGGQMPYPYYDANDGFPAFLLINDGNGRFHPLTEESGLSNKRFRRTYASSFVDLDNDHDLDLLVVSDFSGVDLYFNDGSGYFTDRTMEAVDQRHLFGMASTFADYNLDGRLDFFATGMASTTARRLEYMKLGRRDRAEIHTMRQHMAYGNRMYLAVGDRFEQPEFKDDVARTGWSWGTTSFDFDNDGDPDVFVANGHSSGASTKDHCTHFWCHDIYDASSEYNKAFSELFNDVHAKYLDRSESWDGYQKNALLMNLAGKGFVNIGFLMGVGQQYDGRAVISDDIDADGLIDLIVVEDRWSDGQILHVYRNRLDTSNQWIGVRLKEEAGAPSPIGAKVSVITPTETRVDCVVTGDSIHAQHALALHFGLGTQQKVEAIEVSWPNGDVRRIAAPAVGKYHDVSWHSDSSINDQDSET